MKLRSVSSSLELTPLVHFHFLLRQTQNRSPSWWVEKGITIIKIESNSHFMFHRLRRKNTQQNLPTAATSSTTNRQITSKLSRALSLLWLWMPNRKWRHTSMIHQTLSSLLGFLLHISLHAIPTVNRKEQQRGYYPKRQQDTCNRRWQSNVRHAQVFLLPL